MDELPSDVLTLIFQFDPTYHEQYKQVLLELYSRTQWKIVWVNSNRPPEYTHDERYRDRIIHYWNKTYANFYMLTPEDNLQQCTEGVIKLEDVQ
tara:strand:+ start:285 stop:566 length:282 start_codon:yes stop_codon:yes gene_type:complete